MANIDELLRTVGAAANQTSDEGLNREAAKVLLDFHRKNVEKQGEEIADLRQDRKQRKIFSYIIFGFMCAYMAVPLWIIYECGVCAILLDVSVQITLLTTTLANVIGVFNFVAKYLFHNK